MVKLKQQINKVELFRELEKIAKETYKDAFKGEVTMEHFMLGAKVMFNLFRDNRTKVTIQTFKDESGKYNIEEYYYSDLEPHQGPEITLEVREKYKNICLNNFTIEVEKELMWSKWLVINNKS